MTNEEMTATKRDLAVSLSFIVVGILAIAKIRAGGVERVLGTASLTHATLPTLYGSLLIALAGALFIGALFKLARAKHRGSTGTEESTDRGELRSDVPEMSGSSGDSVSPGLAMVRLFGTLALLIAYVVLLAYVHFLLLTALFLASLFVLYGRRNTFGIVAASVIGGGAFYLLFIVLLNLPL